MIQLLQKALDTVAEMGPVRELRRRSFEKQFVRHVEGGYGGNLYRGVFATFEEAQKSAPPSKPIGYDNQAAADLYVERTRRVYASDYPAMLWLEKLFQSGAKTVFEFGGHIGVAYYAYRKYVTYPPGLKWCVHDVPAVVARGRELAAKMDTHRALSFADSYRECEGFDVYFSAGALQYHPKTLAEMLSELRTLPRYVLLNLIPLHPSATFYTVQSMMTSYSPYRISQYGKYMEDLVKLGYTQRDVWENPDKRCEIAFDKEHSIDRYYGCVFERRA
jgi:putative methyltransferase (TIGR04325 family)